MPERDEEMTERPEEGLQSGDYDRLGGWAALIGGLITSICAFLMIRFNAHILVIALVSLLVFGVSLGAAFYFLKYPKSFIRDVLEALFRQGW
ncbi:hypothetical protein [Maricaulis parjimensis]|uniref:hypothetical protein n=1 Tax=Maricaulis parjimensis TaxID=144023 RepID=UPI0019393ADB|nr:hypothetical protein [Maricaulis parjimensis]